MNSATGDPRPVQGKKGELMSPYLVGAQKRWNFIWGEFVTTTERARKREHVAWGFATLALTALIVNVSHSHRPFIAVVNSEGQPVAFGTADQNPTLTDHLKESVLMDWISNLRMVSSDGDLERDAINNVYAKIDATSPAREVVSDFYRKDPPQDRAKTGTVHVDVKSAIPISKNTYELEWLEVARDLRGEVQSQTRWKAAVTFVISPPSDDRVGRVNPLGLYVTHVNWNEMRSRLGDEQ